MLQQFIHHVFHNSCGERDLLFVIATQFPVIGPWLKALIGSIR